MDRKKIKSEWKKTTMYRVYNRFIVLYMGLFIMLNAYAIASPIAFTNTKSVGETFTKVKDYSPLIRIDLVTIGVYFIIALALYYTGIKKAKDILNTSVNNESIEAISEDADAKEA